MFFVVNEALLLAVDKNTMFLLLNAESVLLLILFYLKNEHLN
jgi:hypothetical protein